jgi:polyisoprenoid-binding protein YceI
MKKILFVFLLSLIFTSSVYAQTYAIDSRYTSMNFRIQHIMGYVVGKFKTISGTMELNEKRDGIAKLQGNIDMNSLTTDLEDRDTDLRSERFFDVKQFPTATFTSTSVSKDKVKGNLTLHGVTKEIALDYKFLGTAKDQYGHDKTAVSLNGKVNRKDFGIVFNTKTDDGKWLLGDDVELMIELEGITQ